MKTKLSFKQSIMAGLMASAAAVVVNAILFLIFHATGTISDSIFIQPNQPLTIVPIIISSVVPTIIASMVFFLFEKFTNNGMKIFTIISIVLLLLSFVNPFMGIPGVTLGYGVILNVMHVVVAGSLLFFINKAVKKAN